MRWSSPHKNTRALSLYAQTGLMKQRPAYHITTSTKRTDNPTRISDNVFNAWMCNERCRFSSVLCGTIRWSIWQLTDQLRQAIPSHTMKCERTRHRKPWYLQKTGVWWPAKYSCQPVKKLWRFDVITIHSTKILSHVLGNVSQRCKQPRVIEWRKKPHGL